jgi:hypothetical protein
MPLRLLNGSLVVVITANLAAERQQIMVLVKGLK